MYEDELYHSIHAAYENLRWEIEADLLWGDKPEEGSHWYYTRWLIRNGWINRHGECCWENAAKMRAMMDAYAAEAFQQLREEWNRPSVFLAALAKERSGQA